jgi:hypothetical protein
MMGRIWLTEPRAGYRSEFDERRSKYEARPKILGLASYCLSALPSGLGHAPSCFIANEFDVSRVQTPGADTANQAVHPSGVGKLVAISMQSMTAVEDCEGTRAAVRWLACGLCSRMAQTTTRRFPVVSTGALVAA